MSAPIPKLIAIPPEVCALADYEVLARQRLDENAWAYIAGGAADEITLRANRDAFDRILLNGRLLRDFSAGGSTRLTLFGQDFAHPIFLAPVAFQKLAHPEGELATALGAAAAMAGFTVSTHASVGLEEISRVSSAPLWFQLYFQPSRTATLELVRRAEASNFRALIVTADAPVNGVRNREQRARFSLPVGIQSVNTPAETPGAAWSAQTDALCGGILATQPTWKDLVWLRENTRLPLVLKGVIAADDAREAIRSGVDGIIVSNHGGRTLDTLPASIQALPAVAAAVEGRVPILLDGGIRRGTDIVKALALGADAVMIGRPYIYGLATAGAVGVAHMVALLRAELEVAMALIGCRHLSEIAADVLWRETG